MCEYEKVNKLDYCSISTRGVTRFRQDDDTENLPLEVFIGEYVCFQKLVKVDLPSSVYDMHYDYTR